MSNTPDYETTLASMIDNRRIVIAGITIISLFFLFFVVWAGAIPLAKAAIAPGVVGVEGQKKIIQHVDGGVVVSIDARNGDLVRKGQTLITLDGVDIRSLHRSLDDQVIQLGVELARWDAIRLEAKSLTLPAWLSDHTSVDTVARAVATQEDILSASYAVLEETLGDLNFQLDQFAEESEAASSRIGILEQKRQLVSEELANLNRIEKSGLITRSQLFELDKEISDLNLEIDESRSKIKLAAVQRAQVESRIKELINTRRQNAIEQGTLVRGRLEVLKQQLAVSANQLDRLRITAPIDGYVVNSKVNTIGGVIGPREPIMELVPRNERLLIESQVEPKDRDAVRVGQSAEVRFSAFDRRSTRPVAGVVKLISADRVIDPATQIAYYNTIVELVEDPKVVLDGAEIHPGMQTDVMIVTGEQTMLQYLLSPLARSFNRALRED
jgi:HlyD family type I secretion membrane fusion protein